MTETFTITLSRKFLPMQLIYKGTTNPCLLKGADFSADFDETCITNHWSNEFKVIQHLEKIDFLYVKKKKKKAECSFGSKSNAHI